MTGAPVDPRTAARADLLRAACTLPIARVHGSLVGRPAGRPWDAAIEPGGRHAAVLLAGAVERWDLDALECVGRWPLPRDIYPSAAVCVGETPAGLCFLAGGDHWRGLAATPLSVQRTDGAISIDDHDPPTPTVVRMVRGEDAVLVRVADGAPFCAVPEGRRCWCDRDGRFVVVERARTIFDVLEVASDGLTPRPLATLTVDDALADEAEVAIDAVGRRVALVFAGAAVIGPWDRWSAARTLPVPALFLSALELCADGRMLVLCAPGHVVRLDTKTGRTSEARFDTNDRRFAIDVASGRVLHLDRAGLRVIDGTTVRTRVNDHGPLVTAAAATPELLVTSADDGSIRVRDRATGVVRVQLQCPTHEPHSVAVACDQVIAVSVTDGLVRWSLKNGQPRPGHALGRTSDHAPPRLVLAPDGRHLALTRGEVGDRAVLCFVVDLASGDARRIERIDLDHSRTGALCLGFVGDRLRGATLTDYSRRLDLWTRPVAGGRRQPAGTSRSLGGDPMAISSDGRWLWWERYDDGEVLLTAAAAELAATPHARWPSDDKITASCAGRSLLAAATDHALLLRDVDGRELDTGLPRGCVPLAFAPDDRALWVRDETGLLLEISLPEALPDGDDDDDDDESPDACGPAPGGLSSAAP